MFDFDKFFSWKRLLVASAMLLAAFGGMQSKGMVISGMPPSGPPRDIRVDATGNLTLGGGTAAIGTVNAQGTQASGDTIAVSNFPVLAAGRDQSSGGNVLRPIAVASDGAVAITDSGDTITVDGSLTVSSARVQGMEAEGATITSDPVLIAGRDRSAGGDVLRGIAVASDGAVAITDSGDSITSDSASHDSFPVNATLQIADVDAPGGAGGVTASTPRVVLANDVALPAGTATIGSVQVVNAVGNPVNARLGDGTDQTLVTAAGELTVLATAQPGVDLGDVTLTASTATVGSVQIINTQANPAQVEIGDGTDTALVTAAGELNVLATAQPGVDLGDVTLTASTATIGTIGAIASELPAGTQNIGDVDIASLPALVAGTATIGTIGAIVNALPAGTNNIGDVDVLTLPALVASTATIGSVQVVNAQADPAQVELGDGTDTALVTAAGELNVIATAQPGVDIGDVTLTAGTSSIGSVQAINAVGNPVNTRLGDGTDQTLVTAAGELNVIATAQPGVDLGDVTLTASTANVGSVGILANSGGTVVALEGTTANGLEVDVTRLPGSLTGFAEDVAHNTGDVGIEALAVHSDIAQTLAGADGDYGPAVLTRLGANRIAVQPEAYIDSLGAYYLVQSAFTTVATGGAGDITVLGAQGAGNSILVVGWIISTSADSNIVFESNGATTISPTVYLGANGGWTADFQAAWFETSDNQSLTLQVSTGATYSVQIRYIVR